MEREFEGKKLLILGGNPETTPLVEIANSMGIKTIVSSGRHTDPAKKAAWKAYDVDGMDVPGLVALANEEQVDGVLVGVADILVPSYCKVCEALNLPCYATQQIVDVFAFKDVFKATCERYGVHGIPEFYLECIIPLRTVSAPHPAFTTDIPQMSSRVCPVSVWEEPIPPSIWTSTSAGCTRMQSACSRRSALRTVS